MSYTAQINGAYSTQAAGMKRRKEAAPPSYDELVEQLRVMTESRNDWRERYNEVKAAFDAKSVAYNELSTKMGTDKRNINGRPVGIASELAKVWEVGSDRITKWVKEGRVIAAGKDAKNRPLYYLDTLKPAPKVRGKRKPSAP